MRYFECVTYKIVYTEDQLKTLFVFKTALGYDDNTEV